MIRYTKLPLPFSAGSAQGELSLISEEWQSHFNTIYYEGSWTVLSLRSPGGDDKNIIPDLMASADYEDTAYMRLFPSVQKLLNQIECPVMAVRFLNLKAGAIIKPHTDKELCFEMGEARLHFPVITNPAVEFYVDDECIILNEGECWYINANLKHSVANRGNADRIHLVIDCKVNDWLKKIMESADNISVKTDNDNSQLEMVIKELRLQNTEVSNQLAQQLEQQLRNNITA